MSTNDYSGNPLRVKRKWFTIAQAVMYLSGLVLAFGLTSRTNIVQCLVLAPAFVVLASPFGPRGRMVIFWPLHLAKRRAIKRGGNSISKLTLNGTEPNGKVPKDGFREAYHGAIIYRPDDQKSDDRLPVLLDQSKLNGALVITAAGLRVGAGGSENARLATAEEITDGIRDTINGHGGAISIAQLLIRRPGNVYAATGYIEAEMADVVMEADVTTPNGKLREYAADRAWDGRFDDTKRLWVVNSELEKPLRDHMVETLLSSPPVKRRPLSSQQVFSSQLWNAAETLQHRLENVGAESPEIADAARQVDLIGRCFDVHPDDLEAHYRRVQHDAEAVRRDGSIDFTDSMLVQRGAMPRSSWAGHDYLLTGRSYHRILHVLGSRSATFPYGLGEAVVAHAQYPIIFSSVCEPDSGWLAIRKQEEAARIEELRLERRASGYKNVPARYEAGLERAAAERDKTFFSNSPPLKISTFFIISAVSLDNLNQYETDVRNLINRARTDVETITGEEEQIGFFLKALNLRRL